ncbi:hypothetical protein UFOVP735_33 [uncultured Caudovirales phage]|uniref:Uncharacterized protein n=1 Tax=uncultured Caudovirales phage TaxID=2100421 RepID=A0A6J7X4C5_9CAUD|nr:hypothetical protein UFOVP735_33 [uncultured Caudovirales phage]
MRDRRLPDPLTSGAPVVENVVLMAPIALVIVLVAGVLLKKLLDGEGTLRKKGGRFLRD